MRFFSDIYYENQTNLQEIKFMKLMDPAYGWALLEIWKLLFFHTELPVFADFSCGIFNWYWLRWRFLNMSFCRKFVLCISCLFCPHLFTVVSPLILCGLLAPDDFTDLGWMCGVCNMKKLLSFKEVGTDNLGCLCL